MSRTAPMPHDIAHASIARLYALLCRLVPESRRQYVAEGLAERVRIERWAPEAARRAALVDEPAPAGMPITEILHEAPPAAVTELQSPHIVAVPVAPKAALRGLTVEIS